MEKISYLIALEEGTDYRDSNVIVQGLIDFNAANTGGETPLDLETLSFQALDFYQKLGYVVQHRLEGFPPGGTRYALTKSLPAR